MKMKNKTHWRSDDLRALIMECMRIRGVDHKGYQIEVVTSRRRITTHLHGTAWLNQPWITLHMPKPGHSTPLDIRACAQVILHEIDHTLGLRHSEMIGWWKMEADWADSYALRLKEKKAQKGKGFVAARFAKAEAKLSEWERKARTAQRLLKKWRSKVRYYQKAIAAKAANGNQED